MLRVYAQHYIGLGQSISRTQVIFGFLDEDADYAREQPLTEEEKLGIAQDMESMLHTCRELNLETSLGLLMARRDDPPRTGREFKILVDAVMSEIRGKLFLFVSPERAKYYLLNISPVVSHAFPSAAKEIESAANSFAFGLSTACVFHSMRAAEIGLRAMAVALNARTKHPLELMEWGKIIEAIEPEIENLKQLPRTLQREADENFYGQAASQFRHFNTAWRVRAAHARETFEEDQAAKVLDHTISFFETLSTRLGESP